MVINNTKLCSLIVNSQTIISKSINIQYKFYFKYARAKIPMVDAQSYA
jgi:hypothetical protein